MVDMKRTVVLAGIKRPPSLFNIATKGKDMERRRTADRRETHLYVAEDRREGPHDRRGAGVRYQEREQERAKIERIRAYREKDKAASHSAPLFSKKRLVYLGITLLVVIVALLLVQ